MAKLRVHELCKERNITIAELAQRLNQSRTTLSTTLSKGNLRIDTLERIANALGVEIGDLFVSNKKQTYAVGICPHCGKPIDICVTFQEGKMTV